MENTIKNNIKESPILYKMIQRLTTAFIGKNQIVQRIYPVKRDGYSKEEAKQLVADFQKQNKNRTDLRMMV
jgi:hypothetical protein